MGPSVPFLVVYIYIYIYIKVHTLEQNILLNVFSIIKIQLTVNNSVVFCQYSRLPIFWTRNFSVSIKSMHKSDQNFGRRMVSCSFFLNTYAREVTKIAAINKVGAGQVPYPYPCFCWHGGFSAF